MSDQFPFTAIVGMETAKLSMIYHAIDPSLGGLLLIGHRGCAKSTLARAFSEILPPINTGTQAPFKEVPLGTTEDRLLGSIDSGDLVEKGKWTPRAGLIEQSNGGILYIDEVNLLPDHLTDSILDSAASGYHRIEREGLSSKVSAKYILVGSMNPEEGDLRPQIVDRFSHKLQVEDNFSVDERLLIVQRRMSFDDNALEFIKDYGKDSLIIRNKILEKREDLINIKIADKFRIQVAQKARELKLEGVRTEISVLKTARCSALWKDKTEVTIEDIQEAWHLCLGLPKDKQNAKPPQDDNTKDPNTEDNNNPSNKQNKPEPKPENKAFQTASNPTNVNKEKVTLSKPHVLQHTALQEWFKEGAENNKNLHNQQIKGSTKSNQTYDDNSQFNWSDSLKLSLKNGWAPGKPGWKFSLRHPTRKANTWILMDASRSTGATNFLTQARNVLLSLKKIARSSRIFIVILKDNTPAWLLKRSTPSMTQNTLMSLDEASGKSYLNKSLTYMMAGIKRQGTLPNDRVILCSDGLISPDIDQSALQAKKSFIANLKRLTQLGVPTLWLHPEPKLGLKKWVFKLTNGLPIKLMNVTPIITNSTRV